MQQITTLKSKVIFCDNATFSSTKLDKKMNELRNFVP